MFLNVNPLTLPEGHPYRRLCTLRAALDNVLAGKSRQQTRDGDKWSSWHAGNVPALRAEIRKLEAQCEMAQGQGLAVRSGPVIPNGCFPLGPRGWGSRY